MQLVYQKNHIIMILNLQKIQNLHTINIIENKIFFHDAPLIIGKKGKRWTNWLKN